MISIVMPVYNAEKYISQTIISIINQTYQDFELIIINDGSTDKTDSICKEFIKKDDRIVYHFQKNKGVSNTRNYGISISRGDYIMFIDADDIYLDTMVETMYNTMMSSNVDIVKCSYRNKSKKVNPDKKLEGFYYSAEAIPYFLKGEIQSYLWTLLIKKECVGEFDASLSIYEDVLFYIKSLLKSNSIYFITDELYVYNDINYNSLTHKSFRDNANNMLKTIPVFHSLLMEFGLIDFITIIDSRIIANICNYIFMIQYDEDINKAIDFWEFINQNKLFVEAKKNYSNMFLSNKERVFNYTLLNKKYKIFRALCLIKNYKKKRQL